MSNRPIMNNCMV